MNKGFLKKYFNENTKMEATTALGFSAAAFVLAASLSPIGIGCAAIGGIVTAGYVNMWQQKATGQSFWKPRTGLLYGL